MSTISLNRIQYLFSKYFIENWKRDMSNFLILFIIAGFSGYDGGFYLSKIIFVILAIIYAGRIFGMLGYKPKGMNYLLIPASAGEKTLVNLILVNIYYLAALYICYILGFLFGDLIHTFIHGDVFSLDSVRNAASFDYTTILPLLLCESILIFGSVYFKRKAIIKTVLYLFCFFLLIMVVDSSLVYFFTENHSIVDSTNTYYLEKSFTGGSGFFSEYGKIFAIGGTIFFTLFFWVLSFLRLKETEV